MKKIFLGLFVSLIGCSSGFVYKQPVAVDGKLVEETHYAPKQAPEPLEEIPFVPPSPEYVWVHGYWFWTGAEFKWVPGQFVRKMPGRIVVQPEGVTHFAVDE